jgi:hypothetical protein
MDAAQVGGGDENADLFVSLPDHGLFDRFTGHGLAGRKMPHAVAISASAPAEQDAVVVYEQQVHVHDHPVGLAHAAPPGGVADAAEDYWEIGGRLGATRRSVGAL